MDKAITTAMLIVIGMVLSILLFNAAYPAIVEGGDAISSMASRAGDRMQSQAEIIHATGELDRDGNWRDVNSNGVFDVYVWVKNIGSTRITAFDRIDLFFGPEGNFVRIPNENTAGGSRPLWSGQVENGTDWVPTGTLCITIQNNGTLAPGRYFVKVTLPNGISDEYFLSM